VTPSTQYSFSLKRDCEVEGGEGQKKTQKSSIQGGRKGEEYRPASYEISIKEGEEGEGNEGELEKIGGKNR